MFRRTLRVLSAQILTALTLTTLTLPASAQDQRRPSHCIAIADAAPGLEFLHKASWQAPLPEYSVGIHYISHASFLIRTPGGLEAVTDFNGYIGQTTLIPDIVTMNHAHSTHWTDAIDPAIPHVLRGWGEEFGAGIDHHLDLDEMLIRNVSTDIRSAYGGTEPEGNSIFIFEVEGLCIAHLGHLHHEPSDEQYAALGRADVLMVPVDGGLTLPLPVIVRVTERLKSSIVIPMHWFSGYALERFLDDIGEGFVIDRRDGPSMTVSLRDLPSRPTVVVLQPEWLTDTEQPPGLPRMVSKSIRCTVPTGSRKSAATRMPMPLSPADDAFAEGLAQSLPADTLRRAEARYLEEPRGHWKGSAGWVALPRTADEAARVVRACAEAGVGVVPYGGGTGLVGGQVSPDAAAPMVISLERMTRIRAVSAVENVLTVEAGAILTDVQSAAEEAGRLFPLSLGSEGSARIGGLLATNAGGVNTLRYGNARDLVLGLEAVLPDGTLWNGLKRLRKDNTGYDLRHLLMGAEGTLGLITAASLKLFPRPAATGVAILSVAGPQAALDLLSMARGRLGEQISAFELIHRMGFDFLAEAMPDLRQPWPEPPDWAVLIEIGLGAGQDPDAALETLFGEALEAGLVDDGMVAQSAQQAADFWACREQIPEANRHIGAISSHDIAVPLSALPEFIERGGPALAKLGDFRINCFGHVGDGNLHYNVFPPKGRKASDFRDQREAIKTCVHDVVHALEGSVSAEHGIGRLKVGDLERYGDPAKLAAMRAIKAALDPAGIMNPGAVLRG